MQVMSNPLNVALLRSSAENESRVLPAGQSLLSSEQRPPRVNRKPLGARHAAGQACVA